MWFSPPKYLLILAGTAAILYGIGYVLRPAAEIIDELHDSQEYKY